MDIGRGIGRRGRWGVAAVGVLFVAVAVQAQPAVITCDEPGWNWVDVGISLTANQPTYWSAATGRGDDGGTAVSPFTILDPGPPVGRLAPDGSRDRVLRGFILAWAVDAQGAEIRWNHLKGDVVIVNYDEGSAWEYTAYAFQALDPTVANGETLGTPGQLFLNGSEYDTGFDLLLLDFYASGTAEPLGTLDYVRLDTALTLMPISIDVRQETAGPVTTKASFTIWNQNEVKLTGLDRCVTCWDDALLSAYGVPNHFLAANLQTDKGKAQIDGLASQLCDVDYDPGDGLALGADPRDVVSEPASLLGVEMKRLTTPTIRGQVINDTAGENLVGMGAQSGIIRADIIGAGPPERLVSADGYAAVAPTRALADAAQPPVPPAPSARAVATRLSASEKGSLLIFPKVELRFDEQGVALLQDTFIDLTNDYPADVQVQMYFVQGDAPFTSSGVDANTNGVADDCEDRIRWSCANNVATGPIGAGGCYPDPAGSFDSLAACQTYCAPTRYSCVLTRTPPAGTCVPDANGPYATLADCEANCGLQP
ncbi:MAG TPA: hypothetical protein P5572_21690 [Phycisphaerae bacterium]|nr:hypothetical protein [Phycisphaerae bacterium]